MVNVPDEIFDAPGFQPPSISSNGIDANDDNFIHIYDQVVNDIPPNLDMQDSIPLPISNTDNSDIDNDNGRKVYDDTPNDIFPSIVMHKNVPLPLLHEQ